MPGVTKYFGEDTFNKEAMKKYLPKNVFEQVVEIMKDGGKESGHRLSPEIADSVAHGMKDWALSRGATHFAHWFQPLTQNITAEKHDAFLTLDKEGTAIERFSGSQLIQSEPDASSFPSGGIRSTFEARGYTAWDPSSPAFIRRAGNSATLCIPSVYLSFSGHFLDLKTPLLRSLDNIEVKALNLLKHFGNRTAKFTKVTLGPEQEYFLVKKDHGRLDINLTGRTLVGDSFLKKQELHAHYFGTIDPEILQFMEVMEKRLYQLGIPVKTRHNEVAPNQYEVAATFEDANLAIDHNIILMDVLKTSASKVGFKALLHEKPFAGINGSGKHMNWSICDSDGKNLLDPGTSRKARYQFLAFLSSIMIGLSRSSDLLRAAVADAGNDFRLGANEAPPAVISAFLGDQLTSLLKDISAGKESDSAEREMVDLGIKRLPSIRFDNTDRNRTAPFAFTGNKFELRAPGSSCNVSLPCTMLNVIVGDGLDTVNDFIGNKVQGGMAPEDAVIQLVKETYSTYENYIFDGDCYSEEWKNESEKRGLKNLRATPDALAVYSDPEKQKVIFASGAFSEGDLKAHVNIRYEGYLQTKEMEFSVLTNVVHTKILPAGIAELKKTQEVINNAKTPSKYLAEREKEMVTLLDEIYDRVKKMDVAADQADKIESIEEKVKFYSDEIDPLMVQVRESCDTLERISSSKDWPVKKYSHLLVS